MNTEELRIGNYIQLYRHAEDSYKSIHKIKGFFFEDTLNDYAVELEDGFIVGVKGFRDIPLTEDILLKCGFYECIGEDVNGYKKYINDDHLEFDVYLNNENHCCVHYLEVAFSNHPQSLHSLQNAIFALTGEELNVEL